MTKLSGATHWSTIVDPIGRTIQYITSNEAMISGAALCSIYDPAGPQPAIRMVRDWDTGGWISRLMDNDIDGPLPDHGRLIVWGIFKGDRPTLDEADALDPMAASAIRSAIANHA